MDGVDAVSNGSKPHTPEGSSRSVPKKKIPKKERPMLAATAVNPTTRDPTIVELVASYENGGRDFMRFKLGDDPEHCVKSFVQRNDLPPKAIVKLTNFINSTINEDPAIKKIHNQRRFKPKKLVNTVPPQSTPPTVSTLPVEAAVHEDHSDAVKEEADSTKNSISDSSLPDRNSPKPVDEFSLPPCDERSVTLPPVVDEARSGEPEFDEDVIEIKLRHQGCVIGEINYVRGGDRHLAADEFIRRHDQGPLAKKDVLIQIHEQVTHYEVFNKLTSINTVPIISGADISTAIETLPLDRENSPNDPSQEPSEPPVPQESVSNEGAVIPQCCPEIEMSDTHSLPSDVTFRPAGSDVQMQPLCDINPEAGGMVVSIEQNAYEHDDYRPEQLPSLEEDAVKGLVPQNVTIIEATAINEADIAKSASPLAVPCDATALPSRGDDIPANVSLKSHSSDSSSIGTDILADMNGDNVAITTSIPSQEQEPTESRAQDESERVDISHQQLDSSVDIRDTIATNGETGAVVSSHDATEEVPNSELKYAAVIPSPHPVKERIAMIEAKLHSHDPDDVAPVEEVEHIIEVEKDTSPDVDQRNWSPIDMIPPPPSPIREDIVTTVRQIPLPIIPAMKEDKGTAADKTVISLSAHTAMENSSHPVSAPLVVHAASNATRSSKQLNKQNGKYVFLTDPDSFENAFYSAFDGLKKETLGDASLSDVIDGLTAYDHMELYRREAPIVTAHPDTILIRETFVPMSPLTVAAESTAGLSTAVDLPPLHNSELLPKQQPQEVAPHETISDNHAEGKDQHPTRRSISLQTATSDADAFESAYYEAQKAYWSSEAMRPGAAPSAGLARNGNADKDSTPAAIKSDVVARQLNLQSSHNPARATSVKRQTVEKAGNNKMPTARELSEMPAHERLYLEYKRREAAQVRRDQMREERDAKPIKRLNRENSFAFKLEEESGCASTMSALTDSNMQNSGKARQRNVDIYTDSKNWEKKRDEKTEARRVAIKQKEEEGNTFQPSLLGYHRARFNPRGGNPSEQQESNSLQSPIKEVARAASASSHRGRAASREPKSPNRSMSSDSTWKRKTAYKAEGLVYSRLYADREVRVETLRKAKEEIEETEGEEIKDLFKPEICKASNRMATRRRGQMMQAMQQTQAEIARRRQQMTYSASQTPSPAPIDMDLELPIVTLAEDVRSTSHAQVSIITAPAAEEISYSDYGGSSTSRSDGSTAGGDENQLEQAFEKTTVPEKSSGKSNFQYSTGYEESAWVAPRVGDEEVTPVAQDASTNRLDVEGYAGTIPRTARSADGVSSSPDHVYIGREGSVDSSTLLVPEVTSTPAASSVKLTLNYIDKSKRVPTTPASASAEMHSPIDPRGRTAWNVGPGRRVSSEGRLQHTSPNMAQSLTSTGASSRRPSVKRRSLSNQSRLLQHTASSKQKASSKVESLGATPDTSTNDISIIHTPEQMAAGSKTSTAAHRQSNRIYDSPTKLSIQRKSDGAKASETNDQWVDKTLMEVFDQMDVPDVLTMLEEREAMYQRDHPYTIDDSLLLPTPRETTSNSETNAAPSKPHGHQAGHSRDLQRTTTGRGEQLRQKTPDRPRSVPRTALTGEAKQAVFDLLYEDANFRSVKLADKRNEIVSNIDDATSTSARQLRSRSRSRGRRPEGVRQEGFGAEPATSPSRDVSPTSTARSKGGNAGGGNRADFYRRLQECKEKREKELEQLEKKLREKQGIKEPPKLSSDEIDRFISRHREDLQKREDKLQKKRAEKCASIDADSSAKRISGRSVKIISNQRRDAWNEIFDVLLWSVSFATKSFDKKEGINEHSSDALGFSISNKLDILDTTKAMPQLIRPQDLANVVQALFHQLLPVEKRMSREDFIECMETFTAGHGFVHNAKNANSVIMEQLLMGAGSNSSSLGNPDQNGLLRSKSSDRLSFMSREFSFSSTAAREDGKASSASAIEQRERALARLNSNATDGSAKSAGVVAPNTFPINMLLNSNNNSMSGQIKNMNVAAEHVVSNRGARNKSSERRVVSASEKLGPAYNNYGIHRRSTSAGRLQSSHSTIPSSSTAMEAEPSHVTKHPQQQEEEHPLFVPRMQAAAHSSKLAFRGEHGERRKLGLSVGAGLHSCDELYRQRRASRIIEKAELEEVECTFAPTLPGQDSFARRQLRRSSIS